MPHVKPSLKCVNTAVSVTVTLFDHSKTAAVRSSSFSISALRTKCRFRASIGEKVGDFFRFRNRDVTPSRDHIEIRIKKKKTSRKLRIFSLRDYKKQQNPDSHSHFCLYSNSAQCYRTPHWFRVPCCLNKFDAIYENRPQTRSQDANKETTRDPISLQVLLIEKKPRLLRFYE